MRADRLQAPESDRPRFTDLSDSPALFFFCFICLDCLVFRMITLTSVLQLQCHNSLFCSTYLLRLLHPICSTYTNRVALPEFLSISSQELETRLLRCSPPLSFHGIFSPSSSMFHEFLRTNNRPQRHPSYFHSLTHHPHLKQTYHLHPTYFLQSSPNPKPTNAIETYLFQSLA